MKIWDEKNRNFIPDMTDSMDRVNQTAAKIMASFGITAKEALERMIVTDSDGQDTELIFDNHQIP